MIKRRLGLLVTWHEQALRCVRSLRHIGPLSCEGSLRRVGTLRRVGNLRCVLGGAKWRRGTILAKSWTHTIASRKDVGTICAASQMC